MKVNYVNSENKISDKIVNVSTINSLEKITPQTLIANTIKIEPKYNKDNDNEKIDSIKTKYKKVSSQMKPSYLKSSSLNTYNPSFSTSIKNAVKDDLDSKDDRTATVSTFITTATTVTKGFNTVQNFTPYITDSIVKTGQGTYKIADKTIKVVRHADFTLGRIVSGQLQLDRDTLMKFNASILHEINKTNPIQRLNHTTERIKTKVDTVSSYYSSSKSVIINGYKVSRGILNGTVKVNIKKEQVYNFTSTAFMKMKTGATSIGKITINHGVKALKRSGEYTAKEVINGYKGLKTSIIYAGDTLSRQDDTGCQAVGLGIKTSNYTVKGIKNTPKVVKGTIGTIKTAINIPIKTMAKTKKYASRTEEFIKYSRKNGVKSAIALQKNKMLKSIAKAGGSVVSTAFNQLKLLAVKALMPLLIIALLIFISANVIVSAGAASYHVLFGWFSVNKDTGEDFDEQQWLINRITKSRNDLVQEVKDIRNNNLKENGGKYHYIRFYSSQSDSDEELTDTNILSCVYSTNDYYQYIQPLFHVLLLSRYDLEVTEVDFESLYTDIWNKFTKIKKTELPTEYCKGGKTENDGNIHADIINCPNYSDVKYHTDTSSNNSCDYTYSSCGGHKGELICEDNKHKHTDACYEITYCTQAELPSCDNLENNKSCNGYYICKGHKILSISISVGNFSDLLDEYFMNRINELKAKSNLSDDEKEELETLNENYDICINYLEALDEEMGLVTDNGNGEVIPIDGVELTALTEFACQFVGNKYVYGGNDINNGIDCSAFVKYVYNNFGVSLPRTSREQVKCGVEVSISEAKAGDLIFYSHGGDNEVYHVALYLGNNKMVHASNPRPYPSGGIKISNAYGPIYKIKRIAN